GEADQKAEDEHGPAERPENGEEYGPVKKAEAHDEAERGEFEEDEPEPALAEKVREVHAGAAGAEPEVRAESRGEHEDGRAEVGNPARDEEDGGGTREIVRLEGGGAAMVVIAD